MQLTDSCIGLTDDKICNHPSSVNDNKIRLLETDKLQLQTLSSTCKTYTDMIQGSGVSCEPHSIKFDDEIRRGSPQLGVGWFSTFRRYISETVRELR